MDRTLRAELETLVEDAPSGVKAKDQEAFDAVVDGLNLWLDRWYPARPDRVWVDLPQAAGRTAASKADVLRIARLYPQELAVAVKAKSGEYAKSEYSASGRGAFGHLGGSGKRGKRSEPKLRLQF